MDIKELAENAAKGIQPTKEQLMDLTQRELYDFTVLVDKLKAKNEQKKRLDSLKKTLATKKSIELQSNDGKKTWIVSTHAIERFIERGPQCKDVLALIAKDLSLLTPAREKSKKHRAASLFNHNFEGAKYYFGKFTGLLYVVVNKNIVKTCHKNESKRWKHGS